MANHTKPNQSKVRIMGGKLRGRNVEFLPLQDLRPTASRIRETLFNWLDPYLYNAHCLDLFSGSGILGFEALSRGAKHVTFIDKNKAVIKTLTHISQQWQLEHQCTLLATDCLKWASTPSNRPSCYDVIFLDPPYSLHYLPKVIDLIQHNAFTRENTLIYVEYPNSEKPPIIPDHWCQHRSKQAGQVKYELYRVG